MIYYDNINFASYKKRVLSFLVDILLINIPSFLPYLIASHVESMVFIYLLRSFFLFCGYLFFFPILQSSPLQASIGEFFFGIKIVDKNGFRVGFWRATYRTLILTFCPWGILFFFFLPNKQCLHDYLSDTLIVSKDTKFNQYKLPLKKIRFSLFLLYFLVSVVVPVVSLFLLHYLNLL